MNFLNVAVPANNRSTQLPFKRPNSVTGEPDVQFQMFTNTDHIAILMAALLKIEERVIKDEKVLRRCNAWYEIMSRDRGRHKKMLSFIKTWQDPATLITFWPEPTGSSHAMTSGTFITLSEKIFKRTDAVLWTAGTLMHELAHTAGASAQTTDAEDSLEFCGFDDVRTKGLPG
ncbi:hypothetical protein [Mesorhizobium sp. CN2-181]|uniref:hypothetical protein n=1 Tax=Mesorhizobium yinganensis TaxID=3157707 RepID=UPI0032B754D2